MSIRTTTKSTIIGLIAAGAAVAPVTASTAATVAPAKTVGVAYEAQLGLQGASVVVTVNYNCPTGTTGGTISGKSAQNIGNDLPLARAQVASWDNGTIPGTCDGTTRTAQLLLDNNTVPFKSGAATATATLSVDGPNASVISISTGYVAINLKK